MHTLSLSALSHALRKKTFSVSELTSHFLSRIKQYDPLINSFITVTEKHALAQATKVQSTIKESTNPLAGIPIAYKDIFSTRGIKTSCASKMLDNYIAPYDATVVEKAKQANMVMLGKTNLDEFAFGSSNETSFYGPVSNPWDLNCVPGGSSGGSAAAVAACLTPAALGTDTGGSVRQPSAFCGITGLKPTYGAISRYGMIAFASSLDQGGPMARSAEDISLLMNVMAGHDDKDSTSANRQHHDFTSKLNDSLKGLKIGLAKEFFNDAIDDSIIANVKAAASELEKKGAELVDISLPTMGLSVPCYYIIAPAEASSNLSRYDGVRFGYRADNPKDIKDLYRRSRTEGFGEEVKRRIMVGTYVLSAGYYDAYYIKAQKIRRLIRDDFTNAFKKVDVILGPTTPTPAFRKGEHSKNLIDLYLSDINTTAVNLAGLPALSMPSGFVNNLPVGTQLIGNYFDEARLLNVAHQFQLETDHHLQSPLAFRE